MPKPIPPELLKTYERAFHEIRKTYRHGVEINQPPESVLHLPPGHPDGIRDSGAPREALQRGPCWVRGNNFCVKTSHPNEICPKEDCPDWQPIPEIAAILAYLEELL